MTDARRREADRLDGQRRQACDLGDHASEGVIAEAMLARTDPRSTGDLLTAQMARLRALEHLADESQRGPERDDLLARWRGEALAAYAQLGSLLDEEGASRGWKRSTLDPIAASLRRAEEGLGLELSPPAADLARRERSRSSARSVSPTFFAKHREGITAVWARDGRAWWHERFVAKFGLEPPADWWMDNPATATGGQIAPHRYAEHWFDDSDQAAFFAEMESRYRAEMGLPGRGEGWVSETHLARCVEAALPGIEVVHQARPPWLGAGQSLDIFVPALELAIEYQGEQHFVAFEHWGGEPGLADRRELDERKREACLRAAVRLVEWRYDEPVSVDEVRRRLGLEEL